MLIKSEDVSFVVQGAIDRENTPRSLESIRKYFPNSEIILSTWVNSDINGMLFDKVVLSNDPGGFKDAFAQHFTNNLLRQLVSSQAGIKLCERKYVLKMRSDLCFLSDSVLNFFDAFPHQNENYKLFQRKIVSCSYFSKKYLKHGKRRIHPTPFHLSDWMAFGLRADIENLYSAPLPNEPSQATYFSLKPYDGIKDNLMGTSHRYAPEQYILYHIVNRHFPSVQFENYMDYNRDTIELSDIIVANNFVIMSPKKLGFACLKKSSGNDMYHKWCRYPLSLPYNLWKGLYTEDVFLKDYQKYCFNGYTLPYFHKLKAVSEYIYRELMK